MIDHFKNAEDKSIYIHLQGQIDLTKFARAISKIAYYNWVAANGMGTVDSGDLVDLILNRSQLSPTHLVGGDLDDPPHPHESAAHTVSFQTFEVGDDEFEVARVRLVASSGNEESGYPYYYVVLGRPLVG